MDYKTELEAQRRLIKALGDYVANSESTLPPCKFCGSTNVVRNGHRKGTQYWVCKHCGHGFVANKGVVGGRYPVEIVSRALYNYYAGMSLNAICEGVRQDTGEPITDTSVYGWLDKYTRIAVNEAENYRPQVGRKWVMDETVITLDGKKWWFITAIDYDTRFLLDAKLSTNRNGKDIQEVLEKATAKTGVVPDEVLTDGWGGYREAVERAYGADSQHIVSKPFTEADLSTNLMERWNGTLKDRLKPMRGMDRNTSFQLILDGFVFFYNYLRPHMGIGDRTPAQAAKVDYPYKSWGDVVKSELPNLEIPEGVEIPYRVRWPSAGAKRKPRKRPQRDRSDTATAFGEVRK